MNILKWILIETYNTDHLMFVKLCHHHSNRWNVLHKYIKYRDIYAICMMLMEDIWYKDDNVFLIIRVCVCEEKYKI